MRVVEILSRAIQYKTVSHSDYDRFDYEEFSGFLDFLEKSFPLSFEKMEHQRIDGYNLTMRLRGSDASKKPYLFIAHYDVVPAKEEEGWPHAPFSGYVDEGKIWGRGAVDDKASLIALLEAMEKLLDRGFKPKRDIYFAFGYDEEVGGARGAARLAEYYKEEGIKFEIVLDEGGAVSPGEVLGIKEDVAVLGLAEKGSSALKFTFYGDEGHSSTPPRSTSIGKMASFIKDVENSPRPARLIPTVEAMLKNMSKYKSGIESHILADPSRYFFILKRIMEKDKQTASMIRTTVAFTMTDSGEAHNVLPREASCIANIRILPGERFEEIMAWFYSFPHDFKVDVLKRQEGSKDSSFKSRFYMQLESLIRKHFPATVISPYLVSGGTDSRHYSDLVENSYRFSPFKLNPDDLSRIHGRGEFISLDNLKRMVEFYRDLIEMEGDNV